MPDPAAITAPPIVFTDVGPADWGGIPIAIVGAGSSLKGFDFNRLNIPGVRVFAVKETIWSLPFACGVFSLDLPWINRQADKLRELTVPIYLAIDPHTAIKCSRIRNATYIQRNRYEGFSDKPNEIQSGGNSGFGAVNVAYLKIAEPTPIVLFGFDYYERGNTAHFNDEQYYWYRMGQNERYWKNWGDNFRSTLPQLEAKGIQILNASPDSTVDAFERCSVDDGVRRLAELVDLYRLRSA